MTASGKTQVYIRLIEEALTRGKTAMLLVPEIALTPQILRRFTAQFGDDVAMLHSALPLTERYDQWKRIRRGEVRVVLGIAQRGVRTNCKTSGSSFWMKSRRRVISPKIRRALPRARRRA